MAILGGFLAGAAYGLLLGPLFIIGIKAQLAGGRAGAFAVFSGSFLSDLVMAFAGFTGSKMLQPVVNDPAIQEYGALVGGGLLVLLGLLFLAMRPNPASSEAGAQALLNVFFPGKHPWVAAGLLINTANPANWGFWIGVATAVKNPEHNLLALGGAILAVAITGAVKIWLCAQVVKNARPHWMNLMVRIAGVVMLVLGCSALLRALVAP